MPPSHAKRAAVADRRAKLVKYRLAGRPYDDIWRELGYSSRHDASKDFSRAMEEYRKELRSSVEDYRETELLRLDQLTLEAVKVLAGRHFLVAPGGKVVRHPDTGDPLPDKQLTLAAIDRLLKIQDRRAKLLGLDKGLGESTAEAQSMLGALAQGIRAYARHTSDPEQDMDGEG